MTSTNDNFVTYDAHYRRMGNLPGAQQIAQRDARDHVKPWMTNLSPDARILDCGCGYGLQLQALHHLGYRCLYGIELVPSMARATQDSFGNIASVEQADAFCWLPNHREEFDVIIINDVLEHIPRERTVELLLLLRSSLKPGGIVHIRVPNMATLLSGYSMYLDLTHMCGFTEYSLMQALDLADFEHHAVIPSRPKLFLWPPRPLRILWRLTLLARHVANTAFHMFAYALRMQEPSPTEFGMNIEIWSRKRRD